MSGTGITFGAESEFLSLTGASRISAAALSSLSFVVAYTDSADSSRGTSKVGTVSGTTITFGAEVEYMSAAGGAFDTSAAAISISPAAFMVAFRDGSDENHGTIKIGTVSGTAISFSAETEFLSADSVKYNSVAKLSDGKAVVAYSDGADGGHGTAKIWQGPV